MEIGLYAESAGLATLDETLEAIAGFGIARIELSTGGQCPLPFLEVDQLLADSKSRTALQRSLVDSGVNLSALNISAFPLHPRIGNVHTELIRKTIQLAGLLGIERIVTQSGTPGDSDASTVPNWLAYPWPDDMLDMGRRQWEQAVALWTDLAAVGKSNGVTKFCFELHPFNLVYNVPTLLQLRSAVGAIIGANFDPSHLMWQGMDIPSCVRALGSAVYHVHIKDVAMHRQNVALVGVIDNRTDVTYRERPWNFCTPGFGHDALWWREFLVALSDVGYDDVLSIENEDPYLPGLDGVIKTCEFLAAIM
jgi:sugar phosphate isomerase/epimerase